MGKGAGDQIRTGESITGSQLRVASDASAKSGEDYAQFKQLLQPLITRDKALAGGSREEALSAAMPVLTKLSSGFAGAKAGIMNSMPAGASRDRALSDLSTQMYTTMGGAQADAVREAPKELAGTGFNLGNMSLQELGAALSGYQGGAQTNEGVMKAKVAEKQAMLNFFGQLAQAGGGMAAAGIFKCWIAEAIYGVNDPRTLLVRAWLNCVYAQTRVGACVMGVYGLIGRQVAWVARRSRPLRDLLKPLFDKALSKALRDILRIN